MKFVSLGSGSSGNCYLLQSGETSILLDAGISIRSLKKFLKDLDMSLEDDVSAVFVTHDHADHIKAVGNIASDCGKTIYATKLVHEGIACNRCLKISIPSNRMAFIEKGKTVEIGNFHITPFDVPHDSRDCVGYVVEADGVRFCLITDIGHVTDTIREQVGKANYLVLESNHDVNMLFMGKYSQFLKERISSDNGHLSNEQAANLLAESATPQLRHVWLCHLSEENNHPVLARKTAEAVLRQHGIIPGVDFELDVLKRKSPSEFYSLI
ncbi:MAG: MBL fold metallo-hydrolase [Bacteroidaceae bacterium]|nr:MBL fold metallo-hydrolase [Bacteroidaceae bacterium]